MLVGELHDIGKLIDKRTTGIKHNLENCPIQLDGDTWRGIIEHHCSRDFNKFPTSSDTFKLCIADNLAASVSRYFPETTGAPIFNVYKLWNPPKKKISQSFIKSIEEIKELLSFIAKEPNADEYFASYGDMLKTRAENATPGKNITSLYTHSKLTGQFYRILISDNEKFHISSEELKGMNKEGVSKLIKKKQNEWKMWILRCKINFSQTPVRAKDLNVFKIRDKLVDEIKDEMRDNIFFNTSDELLFFAANGQNVLDKLKEKVEEYGFWLDTVAVKSQLASLKPKLVGSSKKGHKTFYPVLSNEIVPPICELCQMAKAQENPWIDEESGISEFLCEKCLKIREAGSLLTKFVQWEKFEQNFKVCWVKIWLDYELLIESLAKLYNMYLKEVGSLTHKFVEIQFSTISEFQWDYNEFLKSFRQNLKRKFEPDNVQEILADFSVFKIVSLSQIKDVLEIFINVYYKFFPKFKEITSPIKLSVVGSNIKFPFLENWRLLRDIDNEVNIHLISKGSIKLKIRDLPFFLKTRIDNKTLLHKLVAISEISPRLAKITLNDRADKDFKKFKGLRIAVKQFGFHNVLTYIKMMSD